VSFTLKVCDVNTIHSKNLVNQDKLVFLYSNITKHIFLLGWDGWQTLSSESNRPAEGFRGPVCWFIWYSGRR